MMPLALALLQQAAHRSFSYELTIGLAMLSVCALLIAASLDGAEEKRETDGPIREDSPECYRGED